MPVRQGYQSVVQCVGEFLVFLRQREFNSKMSVSGKSCVLKLIPVEAILALKVMFVNEFCFGERELSKCLQSYS